MTDIATVPALCYINGAWAYFTTCPLNSQWGDDWNDAPYEYNAGLPYEWTEHDRKRGLAPYRITKLAWEGPFETPSDRATGGNSRYSVEMINNKAVAWLAPRTWYNPTGNQESVFAGATPQEFSRIVRQAGGQVYVPME